MRHRRIVHEVTLIAYVRHKDGSKSITDIVETSRHFASNFMRSYFRNPDINEVAAAKPGTPWNQFKPVTIR